MQSALLFIQGETPIDYEPIINFIVMTAQDPDVRLGTFKYRNLGELKKLMDDNCGVLFTDDKWERVWEFAYPRQDHRKKKQPFHPNTKLKVPISKAMEPGRKADGKGKTKDMKGGYGGRMEGGGNKFAVLADLNNGDADGADEDE